MPPASHGGPGTLRKVHDRLRALARQAAGRNREPSAAVIDSQSVRTADTTAASVQDRDGARPLLWNLHRTCRRITLARADAGYTGKLTFWAPATVHLGLVIVPPYGRTHCGSVCPNSRLNTTMAPGLYRPRARSIAARCSSR